MRKRLLFAGAGMLALLGHFVIVHLLLHGDNVFGALLVLAFGGMLLAGGLGFATRRPQLAGVMLLCAFVGSFFSAFFLASLRDLDAQLDPSNVMRDVEPAAIGEQPPGRVVHLTESAVVSELVGGSEHELRRGGVDLYRVAPIAPPGWTAAEPVAAWAAFKTHDSFFGGTTEADGLAEWAKPNRAGFVRAPDPGYAAAIADAEQRHGLHSAPGAPLLEWRDPAAERRDRRNLFLAALLLTQAVWLAGALSLSSAGGRTPPDRDERRPRR